MWNEILKYFRLVNGLGFDGFGAGSQFALSQANVFRHACATPLTVLISSLENDENAKVSLIAAKKLSEIIRSTSAISENESSFKVVDAILESLHISTSKYKDHQISKNILVDIKLEMTGNKLYFQEVISCIINNAMEAYENDDVKPINILVRRKNDHLEIVITDYGSGMSFLKQKLVALKGFTTKKSGKGIGLSFVKRTIEKLFYGNFKITSRSKVGTQVCLSIPLEKPYNQSLLSS